MLSFVLLADARHANDGAEWAMIVLVCMCNFYFIWVKLLRYFGCYDIKIVCLIAMFTFMTFKFLCIFDLLQDFQQT